MKGLVTDIQHFSLHDGPGIRTTVFFKGCPLSCRWCHNPEAIGYTPQLLYFKGLCNSCGKCLDVCPENCLSPGEEGIVINRRDCSLCGNCVSICPVKALSMKGMQMTVDQILQECLLEKDFFKDKGGVTLSGGEVLAQGPFVIRLLKALKGENLNIVLDTCGYGKRDILEKTVSYVDLYYYDLKIMNPEKHREWCGRDNTLILDNLKYLLDSKRNVTVRIPVIPGFNDNPGDMAETADFLKSYEGSVTIHLLPYHSLGASKYEALGMNYRLHNLKSPTTDQMEALKKPFSGSGLKVQLYR